MRPILLVLVALSLQGEKQPNRSDSAHPDTARKQPTPKIPLAVTPIRRETLAVPARPNSYELNAVPEKENNFRATDWIVALFTIVAGVVAILQLRLARGQDKLVRNQFNATFRPKLVLRRIIERRDEKDVLVEVANIGGIGPANAVLHIWFEVFDAGQPVPAKILEGLAKAKKLPITLFAGGSVVVVVPTTDASPYARPEVLRGTQVVNCFGYIEYTDAAGTITYRTGFIRRFDMRQRWWLRADFPDSDWEYID
jgi:hypothetical protein